MRDYSTVADAHRRIARLLLLENLPKGVREATQIAIEHFLREGFVEGGPLRSFLGEDLFCPWDGELHRRKECDLWCAGYSVEILARTLLGGAE